MTNAARNVNVNDRVNASFEQTQNEAKLKDIIMQELNKRNEYDSDRVEWLGDSKAAISGVSGLSLTGVLLKAQQLGLEVVCKQQTVIELK